MKTLRHPNILNWFAGTPESASIDTGLDVVTEYVKPLSVYLRDKADSGNFNFISAWGLYQVLTRLRIDLFWAVELS
ncbi:unnamed protein product [Protopolystoma xenopodis]|uniref:Protein kinase domain-containing protein n=1 Tax=Protopolystoma xenopodis TaxID=117903 RepID=A0A448XRC8_9PLAT|nr:unnamed protein product [Protopolystoma xenopodis]